MLSAKDVKYKKYIEPIMDRINEEIDKHVKEKETSSRKIEVYDIGYHDHDIIENIKEILENECFFDIEYSNYFTDGEQFKLSFKY